MKKVVIRPEQPQDREAIWTVTKAAFSGRPYAGGDEQDLINTLRDLGALSLSLVALDGKEVVGQVTFSPAEISSHVGSWFALGPVSVKPELQGARIGEQLIEAGIEAIKELGAWGCILTGDPNYYSRHGFRLSPSHCPTNESPEFFMLRQIKNQSPDGRFTFHPAFYGEPDVSR